MFAPLDSQCQPLPRCNPGVTHLEDHRPKDIAIGCSGRHDEKYQCSAVFTSATILDHCHHFRMAGQPSRRRDSRSPPSAARSARGISPAAVRDHPEAGCDSMSNCPALSTSDTSVHHNETAGRTSCLILVNEKAQGWTPRAFSASLLGKLTSSLASWRRS